MSAKAVGVAASAVLATVVAAGGLAIADTDASQRAVPTRARPAADASKAMPGTDPKIQHWFLGIEKTRVRFDNVLLRAEQDIKAGVEAGDCSALSTAATEIETGLTNLNAIPDGGPAIAAAYLTPIRKFEQVATDCMAGDFSDARTVLGDTSSGAIADYGRAQETVDEILDAGA